MGGGGGGGISGAAAAAAAAASASACIGVWRGGEETELETGLLVFSDPHSWKFWGMTKRKL
jgi:hypothetical protein